MTSERFRPRTGTVLAIVLYVLAGAGLLVVLFSGLRLQDILLTLPLLAFVGYCGYWLFGFPEVIVDEDGVTLVNPTVTVRVPWVALIAVDTKFALTLITVKRKYTAWAAPAPGVISANRGKREDTMGLPASSYGAFGSLRPGDLKRSDSGAAAFMVRTRWAKLVDAGKIDVEQTAHSRASVRVNWLQLGVALVLIAAVVALIAGAL
ncbi:MAG: PH domain-containing protein [Renibacterium salmoninarum]|nr:PH domain-containing protein [Renibacterium salmoninarum]